MVCRIERTAITLDYCVDNALQQIIVNGSSKRSLKRAEGLICRALTFKLDDEMKVLLYRQRMEINLILGQYGKAIEDISKAIEVTPNDHGLYITRADILVKTGKEDHALADLEKAIELGNDIPDVLNARDALIQSIGR